MWDLVPGPVEQSVPPALKVWNLNRWTAMKVPGEFGSKQEKQSFQN